MAKNRIMVLVDKRMFFASLTSEGEINRIYERKTFFAGKPYECRADVNFWPSRSRTIPRPNSLAGKVYAEFIKALKHRDENP